METYFQATVVSSDPLTIDLGSLLPYRAEGMTTIRARGGVGSAPPPVPFQSGPLLSARSDRRSPLGVRQDQSRARLHQ
jgi:hypothetical protein